MANDSIHVSGLADLNKALQALPLKIERNALRGAVRAGVKEFQTRARANVPVDSGALRKSIKIKTSARGGQVKATLRAGDKTAWYAHLVEFGTKAHFIGPRVAKALAFLGVTVQGVQHPGAKARPFMRPALDGGQRAAVEATAAYLRRRIEAEQLKGPDR
jgi:HK97 gp10 family phage protein